MEIEITKEENETLDKLFAGLGDKINKEDLTLNIALSIANSGDIHLFKYFPIEFFDNAYHLQDISFVNPYSIAGFPDEVKTPLNIEYFMRNDMRVFEILPVELKTDFEIINKLSKYDYVIENLRKEKLLSQELIMSLIFKYPMRIIEFKNDIKPAKWPEVAEIALAATNTLLSVKDLKTKYITDEQAMAFVQKNITNYTYLYKSKKEKEEIVKYVLEQELTFSNSNTKQIALKSFKLICSQEKIDVFNFLKNFKGDITFHIWKGAKRSKVFSDMLEENNIPDNISQDLYKKVLHELDLKQKIKNNIVAENNTFRNKMKI